MIIEDSKFEIYVDDISIYRGDPVDVVEELDKITISTFIGGKVRQKLKLVITKMNYIETEEVSKDKKAKE